MNRKLKSWPIHLVGIVLASILGCDTTTTSDLTERDTRGELALRGSSDHLHRAVSLMEHAEEYERNQAMGQTLAFLAQWAEEQPPVDGWTADPMVNSLPDEYAGFVAEQMLVPMQFYGHDALVIREAIWMRDAARWQQRHLRAQRQDLEDALQSQRSEVDRLKKSAAADDGEPARLEQAAERLEELENKTMPPWLAELRDAADEDAVDDLLTVLQLFDWTIQNIQLEPSQPNASSGDAQVNPDEPEIRPGEKYHAWQALLLGQGDALVRARVFLLMARQLGIDVVMLGIDQPGEPKTWAAGAFIAERLYLFDAELGLPIPGPEGRGIATWQQVNAQPELLRQLDLDDSPYPITAADLKKVVALIDATPGYLRQRMHLVESTLSSEHQLVLSVSPSRLARPIRKMPGITDVQIWTAPYRALRFEQTHPNYPKPMLVSSAEFPLFPARLRHLRGMFNHVGNEIGAKTLYLRCRKPDKEIDAVADVDRSTLPPNLRNDPVAFEKHLEVALQRTRLVKADATYWLGLISNSEGHVASSVDYLKTRTLEEEDSAKWHPGARYNLGRTYEAAGQRDEAIAQYQASQSPQAHGDHLRAKWLQDAGDGASPLVTELLNAPQDHHGS